MLERRRQGEELQRDHQRGDVRDGERAIVRCRVRPRALALLARFTMARRSILVAIHIALSAAFSFTAAAQTPPPAPALVEPAAGAALVQPITLAWNPVVDPDGPIGSYTWHVGTSATFGPIIAAGAT